MENLIKKINYYYKHFKVLIFVPLAFLLIPIFNNNSEEKLNIVSFEKMVFNYYESSFSGVIRQKYIDKNNRNTPIIVLKNEKMEEFISFQFGNESVFNQFKINDTIIKESGQTKILVKRNGVELITQFNFDKHVDRKKYNKSLDTIVVNYIKQQNKIKR